LEHSTSTLCPLLMRFFFWKHGSPVWPWTLLILLFQPPCARSIGNAHWRRSF
jgi:hypothetical protein